MTRPALTFKEWGWVSLVWVAGNALLLLLRPSFPFPAFGQLDSWYYTGFFWDYGRLWDTFGETVQYYGARASWILPGAALHSILPPIAANIVFKLFFSALIAIALIDIGRVADGFKGALLGAALAVFSPQIIRMLHNDYVDAAVFTYGVLAVAAIHRAADSDRKTPWIFAAGVAFTLMVIANLGSIASLGAGVALFHLLRLRQSLSGQLKHLLVYLAAAVSTLAVVQAVHSATGAERDLLSPQWRLVMRYANENIDNPWFREGWGWTQQATWLAIPVICLIWGGVKVLRNPSLDRGHPVLALTGALSFAMCIGFILQYSGTMVLSMYYYANGLLALALPLLLWLWREKQLPAFGLSSWHSLGIMILGLAGLAVYGRSIVILPALIKLAESLGLPDSMFLIAATTILGIWGALCLLSASIRASWVRGTGMALIILFLSIPRNYQMPEITDRLPQRYTTLHESITFLEDTYGDEGFLFWVDRAFPDAVSLASTRLWGWNLYEQSNFPLTGQPRLTKETIVVPAPIGAGTSTAATAVAVFEGFGWMLVDSAVHRIGPYDGIGFDLVCFRPQKPPLDPNALPAGYGKSQMIMGLEYSGASPYSTELLTEAKERDVSIDLEIAGYGPVFRPAAASDFLQTSTRTLPQQDGTTEMVVVAYFGHNTSCRLEIIDGRGRVITAETITAAGRYLIQIPDHVAISAYAFRFSSAGGETVVLPSNLQLYLVTRD